jgi:hypothetical protein
MAHIGSLPGWTRSDEDGTLAERMRLLRNQLENAISEKNAMLLRLQSISNRIDSLNEEIMHTSAIQQGRLAKPGE